jgi:hypothetical protein
MRARLPRSRSRRSLAHNELAGILPEELSGKLVHFSAAHNKLSGPISAAQWAAWTKLETLELENNSLSGSLPGAIGQAVNLNRLSLAHNYFDGPLPAQLGQLAKLKELYLYMNLFTGVIPDALDALNLTKCELTAPADLVGPEAANKPFNIFTQPVPPNIASACTVVAAPPFHLPSGTIPATCWMCLHHRCSAFGDNKCAHVKHILDPRGAGRQMCMCACCASQCNAFREPGVCWPGQNGAVAKASGKSGSSSGSDAPFAIQTHSLPDSMLAEEQQAPAVSGVRAPVLAIGVVVLGVGVLVRRMYAASRGSAAAATPIA